MHSFFVVLCLRGCNIFVKGKVRRKHLCGPSHVEMDRKSNCEKVNKRFGYVAIHGAIVTVGVMAVHLQ